MKLIFDPVKRDTTLRIRGLDFADAAELFAGVHKTRTDTRRDYGEVRFISIGFVRSRMMVVVWAQRGDTRRVISMRKANERERKRFTPRDAN